MDKITSDQIRETFGKRRSGWCASLYMPTHRAGRAVEQDPIRFRNLLCKVEDQLLAGNMRTPEVQEMLKDSRRLLQDQAFWRHQSDGLAVFFSADLFRFFRLPVRFAELVVVSDRFHVKPLLPFLTSDGTFHILAVSQNRLRLLEGTQHTVDEIDLENVPPNLSDMFPGGFPEKQLQFHTGTPPGSGNRAAVFHGHDTRDEIKNRMRQWFSLIDKELHPMLRNARSPLVLAGVDTLFPLYKEVSTYPHLLDEGIPGNVEEISPEDLHQLAWAIVEPVFNKDRQEAYARYRQLAGTGKTTADITEAVAAACHGRIDVLFVALGVQVWGRFDPQKERALVHALPETGDEDLLDLAAIQTLANGGVVYAVSPEEVPGQAPLAAVLRY